MLRTLPIAPTDASGGVADGNLTRVGARYHRRAIGIHRDLTQENVAKGYIGAPASAAARSRTAIV